jgi:hypothetical protein
MGKDWLQAEEIAREYLKTEKGASEPISIRRFEETPFLLGAQWAEGGARVLVYDEKVQTTRGAAALPGYFEFLGVERLRQLSVDDLWDLLYSLGAHHPARPDVGPTWEDQELYQDLFPVIAEEDQILRYIVHHVEVDPPGPFGGSKPLDLPLVLQRWSLQLYPPRPDLDWELEERIERPPLPLP